MKKSESKLLNIIIHIICFFVGIIIGYMICVYVENHAYTSDDIIVCPDGSTPDNNGCCAGETYTDMGDLGFNCCPEDGGNCYPPIK